MKNLIFSAMLLIFTSAAFAADAAASTGGQQGLLSMLPIFLILIFFMYFMIIRPQAKRAKDQKNLVTGLQVGDEVITSGGILGKIEKMSADFVVLTVAEGVNINIQKNAIIAGVPRGTIKSI